MSGVYPSYFVVGSKPWNRSGASEDLTIERVKSFTPRSFFFHWSWKVPDELLNAYECTCFHMTDVPYGRGKSATEPDHP